ncbi:MAG: DUF434 domain-containing protein [Solobacterium sp.]|nr:DUF434 domain-containing protein [Solobacterium sp.]
MKHIRRGYNEEDITGFGVEALPLLRICAEDIVYLLDRGYPYKSVLTFVGNRHKLTERQRTALMRMCASGEMLKLREEKRIRTLEKGCTVNIDAFNAIVLMETALSGSMILRGMDGCYRDLSGLAGSYAVIDKTEPGIERIIAALQGHDVSDAVFFVDAPVSNSGRLKTLIAETAERMDFPIDIRMVKDADAELKKCANVISGDSEVISECISWYNLYEELVSQLDHPWITDVS